MDFKCNKCNASLLKSYGNGVKLRSRHIRWETLDNTAVVQCNMCRSWNDMPISLKVHDVGLVVEVGSEIKKGTEKEKLIITEKATKADKAH